MNKYKKGNSYLIKGRFDGILIPITILTITNKAYQIMWLDGGKTTWEEKLDFMDNYTQVENITNHIKNQLNIPEIKQPVLQIAQTPTVSKTKLKTCPICHGIGTVPNPKLTAGVEACPLCRGNKMIVDEMEMCVE